MTLKDILDAKGRTVHCICPDATLEEATKLLVKHNVGSLVVCETLDESPRPVGIVTERDVLHHCASDQCRLGVAKVAEVMTTELVTASPGDAVGKIMGVMTRKRVRHLPVCVEGRLVGLVSIGDIVKAEHNRLAMENEFMMNYIRS